MHLKSPWKPRLAAGQARPFEKLSIALADDISNGIVAAGDRLPPHRELAYQLDIGVGTVTKAYNLLERRGLVRSVRGRGMFVAGLPKASRDIVDLGINVPPKALSDRLLASTLTTVARKLDTDTFGTYAPASGKPEHRAAITRWLNRSGMNVSPDNVFLTHGAQHALSIAFAMVCGPGSLILSERLTYPGAINLARHCAGTMVGLEMDTEGLRPEELDKALFSNRQSGQSVVYVTPTLHNPTAAIMSLARREEIVSLCTKYDAIIIEDDAYSIFADSDLPSLAMLAPDNTMHISGLAKSLSPGLRIGTLAVPAAWAVRANDRLLSTCTMASLLDGYIMEQWLGDGTAQSVAVSIRREAVRRVNLAKTFFPDIVSGKTPGFHVWLPMPTDKAERIVAKAASAGIVLMSPRASLVDPADAKSGVRISLGGPTLEDLSRALSTIAGFLKEIDFQTRHI